MAQWNIKEFIRTRVKPKPQIFGNPKIIRAGQELDVREWIDEAREDTELYKVLEKYGCIDRMIVDKESVFADMTNIMDLRDSLEQMKQADKLWNSLPLEFRKEFLNDKTEFIKNGMTVLKNKIDAEKAALTETVKTETTTKTTEIE